jgi:hypothetical protein
MNRDVGTDPVLGAMSALRTCDLAPSRSHRLRVRCHTLLRARGRDSAKASREVPGWWQTLGPLLLGAWCVMYLMEALRLAMWVYGS